jgi:hypothetical protein
VRVLNAIARACASGSLCIALLLAFMQPVIADQSDVGTPGAAAAAYDQPSALATSALAESKVGPAVQAGSAAPIGSASQVARARSSTLSTFTYGVLFALVLYELIWNWLRRSRSHTLCALTITMLGLFHLGTQQALLPAIHSRASDYAGTIRDVLLALVVVTMIQFIRRAIESRSRQRALDDVRRARVRTDRPSCYTEWRNE